MLKACIDTNIWISGVVFSGKPAEIVTAAFNRKFTVISSKVILEEIERNLLGKFSFGRKNTRKMINRILQVADLYEPTGSVKVIPANHADNLVLETAALGRAKYLVTGDKEHLLPLGIFRNVKIVDAAEFLGALKR
ncbi:MAG: putative toxin-antitoxin system toxin component, PIN family [Bdellovibrionales bacterium]